MIKENGTIGTNVFKTIEQCRGQEFPVLLTISDSNYYDIHSTTLDAWTRVTVSLFIIQVDNKYSGLTKGLKYCQKKQVAKQAEEQEEIKYTLLRKFYLFLQSRLDFIILLLILSSLSLFSFSFLSAMYLQSHF